MSKKNVESTSKENVLLSRIGTLQNFFDFVRGILVAIDEKGTVVYINKEGCALLGYQRKDILGKNWFEEITSKKSGEKVRVHFKDLESETSESHISHMTYTVLCKNKKEKLVKWNNIISRDESDKFICFLCLGEDITNKNQAKEALYETESKLKVITESAYDAIIMKDSKGKIIYWNKAAQNIFGYDKEEVIGKRLYDLLIHKDYHKLHYEMINKIINDDNIQGEIVESVGIKKDKTNFPLEVSVSALKSKGKHYAIWIIRDVTEKKRAEKEKQELWYQLLQTQKIESLGRLTRNMAHDFKNILSTILGYSNLILEKKPEKEELNSYIDRIIDVGDKALELIEKLLLFSRTQTPELKVVNLNTIIKSNMDVIKSMLGVSIKLELNLKYPIQNVMVDIGQIEQVIMNLIANARDAMPINGRLTIETKDIELKEEFVKLYPNVIPGHYVMMSVSDNGIGMTKEVQNKIFEPFFTTKQDDKNTGLGLSIVFGIIRQHNGHIVVKSKPNEGTTFDIFLPAV